ncbi:MAG: hotdog domain-containing protein, partial [Eubacterium sp.]|nr:hotdog domain-containing protein [Eubacterium sp.]
MLEKGVKGKLTLTVTEEMTAKVMGSGELSVFATPCMIALIEKTAWTSVAPYLAEGEGTVGTLLNVQHTAPTPVGMQVTCETELEEVDRRRLVFRVNVYDEAGTIG